jgi:hypothetical protein
MLLDKILRPTAANESMVAALKFRVVQKSSLGKRTDKNPDFARVEFVRDPDEPHYYRLFPQRYQVFFKPRPEWTLEQATFTIQPVIEARWVSDLSRPGNDYELGRALRRETFGMGQDFWENVLNHCRPNENWPTIEIRAEVMGADNFLSSSLYQVKG